MPDHAALTRDSLVSAYHSSGKQRSDWLVGAEFERHLLTLPHGDPLPYAGVPGVTWLLEKLEPNGWETVREGDHRIALLRRGASVTLEPGSQFELSGAAWRSVAEVEQEARAFALEVDSALAGTGVHQVALGYTPFAPVAAIGWVPKGRYVVMREYLRSTGDLAHHMMKGTCAVQATFDYADEADCARKVRLATLLGPLTTGIFANSPWAEGRPSGFLSWRGHIWTRTDPARTGFPAAAESFTFERWVDWLLQVPMMFRKDRQGRWQPARGQTFAEWLAGPVADRPDVSDWELHLTSVFPEVRVKRTIEVRGADCVPLPLASSFVALFKGLFYSDEGLDRGTELAERFASHGTKGDRFDAACRLGLEGTIGGRRMADWAADLVDVADRALAGSAPDERAFLDPLRALVATGESPARTLLRHLGPNPTPAAVVAACPILGDTVPTRSRLAIGTGGG
jgi:glutamate--cysteine ligase